MRNVSHGVEQPAFFSYHGCLGFNVGHK